MVAKKTQKQFITELNNIFGNLYNYDNIVYTNNKQYITLTCIVHGDFSRRADTLLNGNGCQKYFYIMLANKLAKSSDKFIEELTSRYGDKYDYSLVEYKNVYSPVTIKCPSHELIRSSPKTLLQNSACSKCTFRYTTEFCKISDNVNNGEYDYSLVEYISCIKKVKIICSKHGEFMQHVGAHMNGVGCPICKTSKGEREVCRVLTELNIKFIRQYKLVFDGRNMHFDFYLPDYDIYRI
jgi:hypothetical protein